MQWKIDDGGLVGPIEFTMKVEGVKTVLGDPSERFKRTPDSEDMVYAYDDAGVHLSFDGQGLLNQLTVFPENEVFIGVIQLVGKSIDAIHDELSNNGIPVKSDDAGLWCEKQKVFLVDVEDVVDGVEIYRD